MPDHRLNLRPGRCDFSETRCCETQSISTSDGTSLQRCHVLSRARRRSRAQIQRAGDGLFGKLCCGTVIFRGLSVFALDLSLEWRYAGAISCGTCEAPLRGSLWTRDRRAAAKSGNPRQLSCGGTPPGGLSLISGVGGIDRVVLERRFWQDRETCGLHVGRSTALRERSSRYMKPPCDAWAALAEGH